MNAMLLSSVSLIVSMMANPSGDRCSMRAFECWPTRRYRRPLSGCNCRPSDSGYYRPIRGHLLCRRYRSIFRPLDVCPESRTDSSISCSRTPRLPYQTWGCQGHPRDFAGRWCCREFDWSGCSDCRLNNSRSSDRRKCGSLYRTCDWLAFRWSHPTPDTHTDRSRWWRVCPGLHSALPSWIRTPSRNCPCWIDLCRNRGLSRV